VKLSQEIAPTYRPASRSWKKKSSWRTDSQHC
jgi:hypothetical protein